MERDSPKDGIDTHPADNLYTESIAIFNSIGDKKIAKETAKEADNEYRYRWLELADARYKQATKWKESGEKQAAGHQYRQAAWAYLGAGNTKNAMIAFENSYDAFTGAGYEHHRAGDDDQASTAWGEAADSLGEWSRLRSHRLGSRCLLGCAGLLALIIASVFILTRMVI